MDKSYINGIIQRVLNKEFSNIQKRKTVDYNDRVNFACPYCGDSSDPYKKRGNLYWKSLQYHCYNGGCPKRHTNLVEFLKDFHNPISNKDDLIFYLDYIRVNTVIVPTKDYLETIIHGQSEVPARQGYRIF